MMTRRKRLCVSNTCLPHEISMEKAFANCSYGNAAHDEEGIETLGIVYLECCTYTKAKEKRKKKTLLRVCRRDSVFFFFFS